MYVWTTFSNESGWRNSGITFLTGLINPSFGFGGLDGPIHLAEDTFNPARNVPMSMLYSIVVSSVTVLIFAVAMLYCIQDLSAILATRTG